MWWRFVPRVVMGLGREGRRERAVSMTRVESRSAKKRNSSRRVVWSRRMVWMPCSVERERSDQHEQQR